MYHAVSPAVPKQATARVEAYAKSEGWNLQLIDAGETEDPEYLANPANRCYFCKTNLYATIVSSTTSRVLSGTNLDDLSDYRPGLTAAQEHQVVHPYVDCEIDKATLRNIARSLELEDLHDLPAAPCLSSRVETGIHISPEVLPIINEVELAVRDLLPKVENVRCRLRQSGVVLELDAGINVEWHPRLVEIVKECFEPTEFSHLALKPLIEPYHKGSAFLTQNLAIDITPR